MKPIIPVLFDDDLFNRDEYEDDIEVAGQLVLEEKLNPKDCHFYDYLLPFAITNNDIKAEDLIYLWIFVQKFGKGEEPLNSIFSSTPSDFTDIINKGTNNDKLNLLEKPINHIKKFPKPELKVYYTPEFARVMGVSNYEIEPEEERDLIEKYKDELYKKFVPSIDTAQLKTLWEDAERNNQIKLMCYYYFLNKYITQYAKSAILKQNNWPEMVKLNEKLNEKVQPQYSDVLANIGLLCDIVSMGYENTTWTLSDIAGLIKKKEDLKNVVPIIKEHKIL